MSEKYPESPELTDVQTGPVLRGVAATVQRKPHAVSVRCGPGPCMRLDTSVTPDAFDRSSDRQLKLRAPLTPDHVATQFVNRCTEGNCPDRIILPSGAQWIVADSGHAVLPTLSREEVMSSGTDLDPGEPQPGDLTPTDLAESLTGRVALVTGAAQGFGWEIARGLAALGAVVALADINLEGVRTRAAELGTPHDAFAVNVTDEESVAQLLDSVTARYGGVDLVVSNAGVLKAGSVKELSLKDFRFVTDVNYVGFFLMTKHSAPVMELQNAGARSASTAAGTGADVGAATYLTDIVEINPKSGLEGSNKNGAYAGSKFGGIGLVQSFALELVEQGTKVNAICPGNYLDGPLWSDPENGLFVQYLRAGKVPGARTIDDVRRSYEAKVPLGRGCTGRDVVRALAYVVSQEYETGQAVPVTGGQVMLS